MTDKRYIQISMFAVALYGSLVQARLGDAMQGRSPAIETRTVRTSQLLEVLGARKKAATKLAPCPTLPDTIPSITPVQNPDAPAVAFYPNASAINDTTSPLVQTIGALTTISQSQPGFGQALDFGGPFNPAPCAGLEQVLFASSWQMLSFNRDLSMDNVLNTDLLSFANQDGDFSFWLTGSQEIQMRYDKFANRFYFAMDNASYLGTFANTGVTFGVSDSGVISEDSTWTIVSVLNACLIPDENGCPGDIASGGVDYDLCRTAVDQNAYYFIFDILSGFNAGFYANSAFVIQKESLFNGGPAVVTAFRDVGGLPGDASPYRINGTSLLIPAMNFDSNPEFGYFVQQDPFYFGLLNVYRVLNPGSANPTLSDVIKINVPTTYSKIGPAGAPFEGNRYGVLGLIATGDDRTRSAHIRNKQLFVVQTILVDSTGVGSASGDRNAIRWYQFDLTGDATGNASNTETVSTVPVLVQAGTLFDSSAVDPIWYYKPAIMTNKNGDLSLSGILSGTTQSVSSFNVGRHANDPLGVLRIGATPSDRIFKQGSGPYDQWLASGSQFPSASTTYGQRIADVTYTCFDPVDDTTMWTVQEFIEDGLLQCALARLDPAV